MAATGEKKRMLPTVTLEESYQLCEQVSRKRFADQRWMIGNLPRDKKGHVRAVMALAARSEKLCDIHIGRAARLDLLDDLREDIRNNFMEEESTDQFPALLDTMRRHKIPQQYMHDIVSAADLCVRTERFTSFDQWLQLGCRLGGGTILSLIPIVGAEKSDYEQAAISCGQAIYLTHLLSDIADEIQKLEYFMPTEDLKEFEVDLQKHNPAKPDKAMVRLMRFQVKRIEKLFEDGGHLINYLNLDGQRVMKTVISVYWNLLMKIKSEPETVLLEQAKLSRGENLRFKLKHLLGLEGGVSVIPSDDHHH